MRKVLIWSFLLLINIIAVKSQSSNPYDAGDSFMQGKLYEKAAAEYSKAISSNSKDAYGYYKRGVAYLYMNQFDAAIDDFTTALKINGKDPDSYNNRGLALSYKGDLAGALKDFNEAIKLDPGFSQAFINRGSAYIAQNEFDKALKDLNQAIKIDAKNPEIYLQRARLYYIKEDYKNSLKDYNSVIALGLGSAKVYYNRGNTNFKLKLYEDAIKDYTTAVELDPDELDAVNNRSYTYKLLNMDDKSEADKKFLAEKRNELFTPVDQLKFIPFTNKGGEITIDLPDTWKIIEMPQENPDKVEFIITPEDMKADSESMMVGVTVGIMKNLSKTAPVKSEPEILDYWKGSMDKSNEDMLIYKVIWQRHQQLFGHTTLLNRSTIQATEVHLPFGLYEYALAWGDNLIYLYFQAPEVNFDYFEKLYEIAYKSLKINDSIKAE
ncbi:MAG: tetratricopeptide repeat protein [Candidatus Kapabacteria bacterium]|nr:tetratricopeptide repeat protein [Candidatus Kapabacteria bacterium]